MDKQKPLLKRVLKRGKSIQLYRYECKIKTLEKKVQDLEDQLEESNSENNRLRALIKESSNFTLPLQLTRTRTRTEDTTSSGASPQFKLSM